MNSRNIKSKTNAVFKITRPLNVIISFISIAIAAIICSISTYSADRILLAAVSGALAAAAGNIINDLFDIEIDKINRPNRPLAANTLTQSEAVFLFILFSSLSLLLAYFINLPCFIIDASAITLLFLYSFIFKKVILLGNFIVAFLTGLTFIYGGVSVGNLSYAIMPAVFAFLINFIREIIKDMEDIEGDKLSGVFSFPYVYGSNLAKKVIALFSLILIAATFIPYIYKFYKIEYFIIVMALVNPVLIYTLRALFKNDDKKNLNKISFMLKLDMLFGLIAIYLGK
jgi:geranylgeranylglycerol-phosphate geranylgeranyltransferase